ncbi:hypothetical protein D3C72_2448940 [compost metagenome]
MSEIAVEPFRRGQLCPAEATGDEILTLVAHDAEERVIGLEDPASELPDEDPDNVSVDQALDLRFALFELFNQCC